MFFSLKGGQVKWYPSVKTPGKETWRDPEGKNGGALKDKGFLKMVIGKEI